MAQKDGISVEGYFQNGQLIQPQFIDNEIEKYWYHIIISLVIYYLVLGANNS